MIYPGFKPKTLIDEGTVIMLGMSDFSAIPSRGHAKIFIQRPARSIINIETQIPVTTVDSIW